MSNTTSRARRRRSARAAFLLLWLTASLTVSSCGGGSDEPGIPRATAEPLAERSELIAEALARGERCAAAHEADRLLDEAIAAVETVPPRFREELLSAANELVNAVNCPPLPVVEEEDEDEDRGKGKGKGKKGDDD